MAGGHQVPPSHPGDTVLAMRTDAMAQLSALITSNDWFMRVLRCVRAERVPDAWTGAGALRDLVWGKLYGPGFSPADMRDVDVAFFDPNDLSRAYDDLVTGRLGARCPGVPWQARNQAAVHTWYADKFGGDPPAPLISIEDAIGTWPETATAVAVRLGAGDAIEICAPLGVADLMGGVWRRNPRRVSLEESRARLARHRPGQRWPGVAVVGPG
jgi:uncharacterized protein